MAIDYHATTSAPTDSQFPQSTLDVVSNTNVRDVSDMLDLLVVTDTPFINDIGWGSESGGLKIEWIAEDLGPGYLKTASVIASGGVSITLACVENLTAEEAGKQIQEGSILYHYSSTDGDHGIFSVASITTATGTVTLEVMTAVAYTASEGTSIATADKIWILGAVANTGSLPRTEPNWRARALKENNFMILRQDVNVTGSQQATDMYAIGREDQHQILMRLKEMQREREKMVLYSGTLARSTTLAATINGVFGFLATTSGDNIDITTTSLTESAVNTVVGHCWENGADQLTFYGDKTQCAKFTQWDKQRIRMAPRDTRGGGRITKYMTEVGIEINIQPMRRVPTNMAFVVDPSKCAVIAKKGRKAIMEKLGKKGDFDAWQILSEFSFEMKGYSLGQHGMFTRLS